jgi:hypothetical protein
MDGKGGGRKQPAIEAGAGDRLLPIKKSHLKRERQSIVGWM